MKELIDSKIKLVYSKCVFGIVKGISKYEKERN